MRKLEVAVKSFEGRKCFLGNRRGKDAQCGQALIELAFVIPMLMILALAVIEIGRYAYIDTLVGNAARAGTAYGAQSLPQSANTSGTAAAAGATFQSNVKDVTLLNVPPGNRVTAFGCVNGGTVTSFN